MLAALALLACSRTTDVYVGSHFEPATDTEPSPPTPMAPSGAGEGSAPIAGDASTPPVTPGVGAPSPVMPDAGPSSCAAGLADCDGSAANGCETDTTNDPLHCGSCGVACQTDDCACVDGERTVTCASLRGDCDGDAANGCETDLTGDAQHCGECDRACSTAGPSVASATCTAGVCVLTCQTPSLRGDCDDNRDNGCEADLFHDPNNCGTCGMQCAVCADRVCL